MCSKEDATKQALARPHHLNVKGIERTMQMSIATFQNTNMACCSLEVKAYAF